ncbi:aspartyl protease APCB1 isoform X1 [Quercus robur]|uniref:aspartyl protease APCB1 isoform X1 n=1 Tax=Quercus robur TaxID=38942 RepID=UPI0021611AB2|nr:aspartyl protease APCB1 isoform X1 [Quercus robur]
MDSDEAPPQVRGFVIITLPPPDNPSLGKTITAFTISNNTTGTIPQTPTQTQQQPQPHHNNNDPQDPRPPQQPESVPNPQVHLPPTVSRSFIINPRKLLAFLGISLLALVLYGSVSSPIVQDLRDTEDDDEDDKPGSILLPLYRKWRTPQKGLELKLGSFVDMDKGDLVSIIEDEVGDPKTNNLLASNKKVDPSSILPVRGNVYPDGLYYTYILVGDPPKRYFLDIDTGSDLTWIQCDAPCISCAKGANALYKPTKDNILPSKDLLCMEVQRHQAAGYCQSCQQCDYEIQYADQSSSVGVLARDELHLLMENGSWTNLNLVFGCAYDQKGLLLSTLAKTDGILGLSRSKVSLPSQLARKGIIKNVLGHCLTIDGAGGYLFLGDDFVPQWGMSWVPMLNGLSMDFYHSEIMKMNYGSRRLRLGVPDSSVGPVIFDSGSSYTYFLQQAYSDLVASLEEVSGLGLIQDTSDLTLPICWKAESPIRSVKDVKHFFKTLTLQFWSTWWIGSTKLQIPPEGYLIISDKGNVCLGILDGSKVHDGSTIILGDISLRGKLVIYDNVKHKIGWQPSDCIRSRKFKPLRPFWGEGTS